MEEHADGGLLVALDQADLHLVDRLLEQGNQDVTLRDDEQRVALHYAAELADADIVRRILDLDPTLLDALDVHGYRMTQANTTFIQIHTADDGSDERKHGDHRGTARTGLPGEPCRLRQALTCTLGCRLLPGILANLNEEQPFQLEALILLLSKGALVSVPDIQVCTARYFCSSPGSPCSALCDGGRRGRRSRRGDSPCSSQAWRFRRLPRYRRANADSLGVQQR